MKLIASNKKAERDYFLNTFYEAGIVLKGSEVKSLRAGKASLQDSYADVKNNELYLYNLHISPYNKATFFNHTPKRTRKLLLHRREIDRLIRKIEEKGYTLIPTKIYFNDAGKVKVEIALAKGRKKYDKREYIAQKDMEREIKRHVKLSDYKG